MACLLSLLLGTVAASPTVRITEPAPWSLVHGDGPDERQYRDVRVTLRYDGLTTTDHALWLRVKQAQWPWLAHDEVSRAVVVRFAQTQAFSTYLTALDE